MEKSILITLEEGKIEIRVNSDLDQRLKNKLGINYKVDLDGHIKQQAVTAESTFKVKKGICEALIEEIKTHTLNEEEQQTLDEIIKNTSTIGDQSSAIHIYFYRSYINALGALYADVKDRENNIIKENKEIPKITEINYKENSNTGKFNTEEEKKAYELLVKAISKFPEYITIEKINEAFKNIRVCKTFEEFKDAYLEGRSEDNFSPSIAGFIDGRTLQIVLPPDTLHTTIVHEIVHFLSSNKGKMGVLDTALELREESVYMKDLTPAHINILNEALTEVFTEIICGTKTVGAYAFGARFFRKMYELTRMDLNDNRFVEAFFRQNKRALESIAYEVYKTSGYRKNNWYRVLDSSYKYERMMGISFKLQRDMMTEEEIKEILTSISRKYTAISNNDERITRRLAVV